MKGISKRTNKYTYEQYKRSLYENATYDATNYTIRVQDDEMCTMKCLKRGLTGIHVKNMVQNDRVSTKPYKHQRIDSNE